MCIILMSDDNAIQQNIESKFKYKSHKQQYFITNQSYIVLGLSVMVIPQQPPQVESPTTTTTKTTSPPQPITRRRTTTAKTSMKRKYKSKTYPDYQKLHTGTRRYTRNTHMT